MKITDKEIADLRRRVKLHSQGAMSPDDQSYVTDMNTLLDALEEREGELARLVENYKDDVGREQEKRRELSTEVERLQKQCSLSQKLFDSGATSWYQIKKRMDADHSWRPNRAHVEQLLNEIHKVGLFSEGEYDARRSVQADMEEVTAFNALLKNLASAAKDLWFSTLYQPTPAGWTWDHAARFERVIQAIRDIEKEYGALASLRDEQSASEERACRLCRHDNPDGSNPDDGCHRPRHPDSSCASFEPKLPERCAKGNHEWYVDGDVTKQVCRRCGLRESGDGS